MRTKSLAFLAGIIWLTAGFNVCRIGVVSYLIMIFMITFGVLLRRCPAVPAAFIASFYVGLGSALALAGVIYISACFCPKEL